MVVVDVHASDSLREFASALRRRGVDVVHLRPPYTGRGSALKQRVDSWAGPVVPLELDLAGDSPAAAALRRQVLASPTVDVHATEPVLARLCRTPEWSANPALRKVRPALDLLRVLDKWEVSRLAHDAGVRVPEAWTELVSDEYPVMVKGRLGVGGMFVRVAHDEAELERVVASYRAEGVEPFLERRYPHVTGIGTGGVCKDGRVLSLATYERMHDPERPLAPSIAIRAYHSSEAEAETERLMAAIGYTGMFCLNFVPDAEGHPLLIDVNTRAFGVWASLDLLGVPVLDSYLEMLGAGPAAPAEEVDPERWLTVARMGHVVDRSWRDALDETRTMGRVVLGQRRLLGWGWTAAAELRVLQTGAQSAAAVLRARRRS
ncbi:MAG: ATP-grasp domain-containing protein [Candidatus Nanopelagicales bacterium]